MSGFGIESVRCGDRLVRVLVVKCRNSVNWIEDIVESRGMNLLLNRRYMQPYYHLVRY